MSMYSICKEEKKCYGIVLDGGRDNSKYKKWIDVHSIEGMWFSMVHLQLPRLASICRRDRT